MLKNQYGIESSELHIQHYDDEGFATIDAIGGDYAAILGELGAQEVGDGRYRLPIAKLGEFCDRRFGVERKPPVTDEQRRVRSENMKRARESRWSQSA